MTDLGRDTGGTSLRRGVHGDPWRGAIPMTPRARGHATCDTACGCWARGAEDEARIRRLPEGAREVVDLVASVGRVRPMTREEVARLVFLVYVVAPLGLVGRARIAWAILRG